MNIRGLVRTLVLAVFLMTVSGLASAQDKSSLPGVMLTLVVDRQVLGLVECLVDESTGSIQEIETAGFRKLMDPLLEPALLERLTVGQTGMTPAALVKEGMVVLWDPQALELRLDIPLLLRKQETLPMVPAARELPGTRIGPSAFSAYLNMSATQYFALSLPLTQDISWAANFDLQAVMNMAGWVFEAKDSISTVLGPELPALSLTRDFPRETMRMVIGDYSLGNHGFLAPLQGQGISFRSQNKETNTVDLQGQELFLEQDSTVEILLNGRKIQTLHLDRGRYNLSDFPFYNGINQVEIRIRGTDGDLRILHSTLPEDSEGPAVGEDDWSYALGIPPWDPSDIMFDTWFAHGFASWFKAGLGTRLDLNGGTFTLETLMPTPLGTLSLDGGFRITDWNLMTPDWAMRAGWKYRNNNEFYAPVLGLGFSWTGPDFLPDPGTRPVAAEITASLGQSFGKGASANALLSWQSYHDLSPASLNLSFHFNLALDNLAALSLGLNMSLSQPDPESTSLTLELQMHDASAGSNLNVNQDLLRGSTRVDIQETSPADGLNFSFGAQGPTLDTLDSYSLNTALQLANQRFLLSTTLGLQQNPGAVSSTGLSATLNLAAALVFAQGHLSLSRPVNDSFALVIPRYDLEGQDIGVNASGRGFEASSDILGYPVLSQLSSGTPRQLNIEVLDSSPGAVFVRENGVVLDPAYHSGLVVQVGSAPEILATLSFRDASGKALGYIPGSAISSRTGVEFFSDEKGVAIIYGLTAETYRIVIPGFKEVTLDLSSCHESAYEGQLTLIREQGATP